jgi:hypothetical protein
MSPRTLLALTVACIAGSLNGRYFLKPRHVHVSLPQFYARASCSVPATRLLHYRLDHALDCVFGQAELPRLDLAMSSTVLMSPSRCLPLLRMCGNGGRTSPEDAGRRVTAQECLRPAGQLQRAYRYATAPGGVRSENVGFRMARVMWLTETHALSLNGRTAEYGASAGFDVSRSTQ